MDLWEFPHKVKIANFSKEICELLPYSKGEERLLKEALYHISTHVDTHSQVIWDLIVKLKNRLEESENVNNILMEQQRILVQENEKLMNMLHKVKSKLDEHVRVQQQETQHMNDAEPLKLKKKPLSIIKNNTKDDLYLNTFVDKEHQEEIEETSPEVYEDEYKDEYKEDEYYIDESCAEEDEEYDIEYVGDELDDLDEEDFLHTPRRTKKGKKIKSITKNARARQNKNDRRFRLKKSMLTIKELNAFDLAKEFKDPSVHFENIIDDMTSDFRALNYHDVTILR